MIVLPTTLRFKGERDYLHGTDIYDALIDEIARAGLGAVDGLLDLTFSRFCTGQVNFYLAENEDDRRRPEDTVGYFNVTTGQTARFGWVVQTTRPVTDRYAFDESRITDNATLSGEQISYAGHGDSTPPEIAVVLTKHLHNVLFPPQGRRWVVTRFDLSRPFEDQDKHAMAVRLAHNMNNRLTKSSVSCGGEALGSVFFASVER